MRIALRSAAIAAAWAAAALAQTPSQTGAIAGHVVDATTARPVSGATVHLVAAYQPGRVRSPSPRTTASDSLGAFLFDDVDPADYTLNAENDAGFGSYGATRANGRSRTLHVSSDAHVDDVTISLWALGRIEGRVTDEGGGPLAGIDVQLEPSESASAAWTKTGPDGHYRARHLPPGRYIAVVDSWLFNLPLEPDPPTASLSGARYPFLIDSDRRTLMLAVLPFLASDVQGRRRMFVTSVHSTPRGGHAEPIRITAGELHTGIDIILAAKTGVRVTGQLTTPSGPVEGGVVTLRRVDLPENLGINRIAAGARPDGTFAFVAVPPGRYALTAYKRVPPFTMARLDGAGRPQTAMDDTMSSDDDDYSLEGSLDVGTTDMSNLVLSIQPGTTVSGTLTLDGHAPEAGRTSCVYLLSLVKRRFGDARVGCRRSDGTFSLKARPGTYVVTAGPFSKDWAYDGTTIGGRQIADGPITVGSEAIENVHVRLTSRRRGIAGTVVMSDGRVPESAGVIVFPRDRKWWASRQVLYQQSIYPDRENRAFTGDGRFEFLGLLPGKYFAAAVEQDVFADPVTPATLSRLVRIAVPVTVPESGLSIIRLRLR
jgi:carboxypeptidase family protein